MLLLSTKKQEVLTMKKLLLIAAVAITLGALTGCGSARTPTEGPRSKNTYYNTFFGVSIESAVYGDGLVVNAMK